MGKLKLRKIKILSKIPLAELAFNPDLSNQTHYLTVSRDSDRGG